jgi:hypothetical protein
MPIAITHDLPSRKSKQVPSSLQYAPAILAPQDTNPAIIKLHIAIRFMNPPKPLFGHIRY